MISFEQFQAIVTADSDKPFHFDSIESTGQPYYTATSADCISYIYDMRNSTCPWGYVHEYGVRAFGIDLQSAKQSAQSKYEHEMAYEENMASLGNNWW